MQGGEESVPTSLLFGGPRGAGTWQRCRPGQDLGPNQPSVPRPTSLQSRSGQKPTLRPGPPWAGLPCGGSWASSGAEAAACGQRGVTALSSNLSLSSASTRLHLQNGLRTQLEMGPGHLLCVGPRPALGETERNGTWPLPFTCWQAGGSAPGPSKSSFQPKRGPCGRDHPLGRFRQLLVSRGQRSSKGRTSVLCQPQQ